MGQKVNPNGLRYGIYRNYNSRWFAKNKDFATFLHEDCVVREFLTKELKEAQLSHVEIERFNTFESGYSVVISVHVARVGVVVGQSGERVKLLTEKLKKLVKTGDLKLNVVNVEAPYLNASLVAQDMATQLEQRGSFRIVQKKTIQKVRKEGGAKGIKTLIGGRLNGAEIARREGYKEGIIPLHTLRSDIDYAHAEAHTTYGRLGVKVWICRGEYDLNKKKGE